MFTRRDNILYLHNSYISCYMSLFYCRAISIVNLYFPAFGNAKTRRNDNASRFVSKLNLIFLHRFKISSIFFYVCDCKQNTLFTVVNIDDHSFLDLNSIYCVFIVFFLYAIHVCIIKYANIIRSPGQYGLGYFAYGSSQG